MDIPALALDFVERRIRIAETGFGPSVGVRLPALMIGRRERKMDMSEKEKQVVEKIAKLPEQVRERFLTMAEGAVIAVEELREEQEDEDDAD